MKPQEHTPNTNMVGKIPYTPHANMITINNPRNSWIIDSRDSEHITTHKNWLKALKKIKKELL